MFQRTTPTSANWPCSPASEIANPHFKRLIDIIDAQHTTQHAQRRLSVCNAAGTWPAQAQVRDTSTSRQCTSRQSRRPLVPASGRQLPEGKNQQSSQDSQNLRQPLNSPICTTFMHRSSKRVSNLRECLTHALTLCAVFAPPHLPHTVAWA